MSCCEVATGTTISAETSSSPTVRIATVTVTAASTGDQHVVDAHAQPGDPGELLVLGDREQLGRQPDADDDDDRGEHHVTQHVGRPRCVVIEPKR